MGPHLPIATDYLIASAFGEKIAEKLGAFLLPALPISTCLELMLYLHPELVRKERIEDCIPSVSREYLNYDSLLKYSKNGVRGMPSLASEEKGEKIFNLIVKNGADYIVNTFDFFNHNA